MHVKLCKLWLCAVNITILVLTIVLCSCLLPCCHYLHAFGCHFWSSVVVELVQVRDDLQKNQHVRQRSADIMRENNT